MNGEMVDYQRQNTLFFDNWMLLSKKLKCLAEILDTEILELCDFRDIFIYLVIQLQNTILVVLEA